MKTETELFSEFLSTLEKQGTRKANLYDGKNKDLLPDVALRFAIEELGEVATAITRGRINSAMDECIDLAHCAFLIYQAISKTQNTRRGATSLAP